MIVLETPRVRMRNWEERDRDAFFHLNADPRIMALFDARPTRAEADAKIDEWRQAIAGTGLGFAAMELKQTGETVGIAGLHVTSSAPAFPDGAMEVGWRPMPEHWGKGLVTEAAAALLDHAFGRLRQPRVIAIAVWNNDRSTSVMRRLGMRQVGAPFEHPDVSNHFPHLKCHVVFGIEAGDWSSRPHGPTGEPPLNPSEA